MIKAPIFLFLLALLLNLVESLDELLKNNPYSKLIEMVRKEIVDKALLYLPKREEINILQMFIQMAKTKEEYSLSDADSAYLAYKWIELNIKWEDSDNEDLGSIYNSGKGNPFGISTLFNRICSYLEVESGSIYGSYKFIELGIYKNYNYTWNYVLINGSYYLIDAITFLIMENLIFFIKIYFLVLILKYLFVLIFLKKLNGNYYQNLIQENNFIHRLVWNHLFIYMVSKLFHLILMN